MKKNGEVFIIFNVIVFVVLLVVFLSGTAISNGIDYRFSGNSWLNPVSGKNIDFTGLILQIFSMIGILIQLVFVNKKLLN